MFRQQPSSIRKRWAIKWLKYYDEWHGFRPQRRGIDPNRAQQWNAFCRRAWQLQRRWYSERGYFQPTTMIDPPPGNYQQGMMDYAAHEDDELRQFRRDHARDIGYYSD